jgi:hypothetical protein
VGVVKTLLRFFGYLYHGILGLFLLAVSGVTLISGTNNLQLGMLPWQGSTLTLMVFFGALIGLLSVLLAMMGKIRPLFFVWALLVLVLMVKGYVLSSYHFSPGEGKTVLYLGIGALISVLGAFFGMFRTSRPRY